MLTARTSGVNRKLALAVSPQSLLFEVGDEGGRVVGDNGVDFGVDEFVPLGRGVGGPGDDLETGLVGFGDAGLGDEGEVGGDDGGSGFAGNGEEVLKSILVEGGEADIGEEIFHLVESAEVEGLDDDAGAKVMLFDGGGEEAGEFGGRGRQFGLIGEALGFDVELKGSARGEGEHLIEGGDMGAGDGLLKGERRILPFAAIPLAEFEEGHLMNGLRYAGAVAEFRVDLRVVGNDEDIVAGDGEVEFQSIDARLDGVFEGGEGVFGAHGARAAVSVDLDGLGRESHCGQESRQTQYHDHSIANRSVVVEVLLLREFSM